MNIMDTGRVGSYLNENTMESYLRRKGIPFKRNVKLYDASKCVRIEIDFVIPGAVIEVKSEDVKFYKKFTTEKIVHQISRLAQYVDDADFTIYLIVVDDDQIVKKLVEHDKRIKVITNMNEIVCSARLPYFCNHVGMIRTLGSLEFEAFSDTCDLIKGNIIFGDTYLRAISIMTDEELDRLSVYKFTREAVSEYPYPHIEISSKSIRKNLSVYSMSDKYTLLYIFDHFLRRCPLGPTVRAPIRLFEKITKFCDNCNTNIIFYENDMCPSCKNNV